MSNSVFCVHDNLDLGKVPDVLAQPLIQNKDFTFCNLFSFLFHIAGCIKNTILYIVFWLLELFSFCHDQFK